MSKTTMVLAFASALAATAFGAPKQQAKPKYDLAPLNAAAAAYDDALKYISAQDCYRSTDNAKLAMKDLKVAFDSYKGEVRKRFTKISADKAWPQYDPVKDPVRTEFLAKQKENTAAKLVLRLLKRGAKANGKRCFWTRSPTEAPTSSPTTNPSTMPTTMPSFIPTTIPTTIPSTTPTTNPSTIPTTTPTTNPSTIPTTMPSFIPTTIPTTMPSTGCKVTPGTDVWSAPSSSPAMKISGGGTLAQFVAPSSCSGPACYKGVVGEQVMTEGKHYWEVTVTAGDQGWSNVGVTVEAPKSDRESLYHRTDRPNSWMISDYAGGLNGPNEDDEMPFSKHPYRIPQGETVGVLLDLDLGSLMFYKKDDTTGEMKLASKGYPCGVAGRLVRTVEAGHKTVTWKLNTSACMPTVAPLLDDWDKYPEALWKHGLYLRPQCDPNCDSTMYNC